MKTLTSTFRHGTMVNKLFLMASTVLLAVAVISLFIFELLWQPLALPVFMLLATLAPFFLMTGMSLGEDAFKAKDALGEMAIIAPIGGFLTLATFLFGPFQFIEMMGAGTLMELGGMACVNSLAISFCYLGLVISSLNWIVAGFVAFAFQVYMLIPHFLGHEMFVIF
tara:strand:- start:12612 stop:13112 length:501 start_codon:yes stop_codon:yes gene_type:complete